MTTEIEQDTDAHAAERRAISMGRGRWGDPTFIKTDWEFVCMEDLGKPVGRCDMCGTSIRYVQHLTHLIEDDIETGCVCSGYLTGELDRAVERHTAFVKDARNAAARAKTAAKKAAREAARAEKQRIKDEADAETNRVFRAEQRAAAEAQRVKDEAEQARREEQRARSQASRDLYTSEHALWPAEIERQGYPWILRKGGGSFLDKWLPGDVESVSAFYKPEEEKWGKVQPAGWRLRVDMKRAKPIFPPQVYPTSRRARLAAENWINAQFKKEAA